MAFLLRGAHVVDPQVGLDGVADVLIDGDKIEEVGQGLEPPADVEVIDASGKYLVPGLVDMHVHFRDPGFEYKETIDTGSMQDLCISARSEHSRVARRARPSPRSAIWSWRAQLPSLMTDTACRAPA